MIVLDTNVLSEPLRAQPDRAVLDWLGMQSEPVGITSITVGELLTGIALLPPGHRRTELAVAANRLLANFASHVFDYDAAAAKVYASLQEQRRRTGRSLSVEDGMIASICLDRGATLATRNTKDFAELGLDLINPWLVR